MLSVARDITSSDSFGSASGDGFLIYGEANRDRRLARFAIQIWPTPTCLISRFPRS
jgi:hypothetical protein